MSAHNKIPETDSRTREQNELGELAVRQNNLEEGACCGTLHSQDPVQKKSADSNSQQQ
jgi:hypothetical protein